MAEQCEYEGHGSNCSAQWAHDQEQKRGSSGQPGGQQQKMSYKCLNGTDQPHAINLPNPDDPKDPTIKGLNSSAQVSQPASAQPPDSV